MIALGSTLTLKHARSYVPKQGSTMSGVQDVGFATEWHLEAVGRPRLTIRDTRRDSGERDVVLQQVPLLPEMPAGLANLHGRHRVGIAEVSAERRRITAFLPLPQPDGRPRQKRALTTAQLAEACGRALLCELVARPGVSLTPPFDPADPQDIERCQHAVVFEDEDRETPVIAYTHPAHADAAAHRLGRRRMSDRLDPRRRVRLPGQRYRRSDTSSRGLLGGTPVRHNAALGCARPAQTNPDEASARPSTNSTGRTSG
ncbi:hypothetical protein AB0E62_25705 [Streptomyces sp. NPDC038707]|uniref:hypothetical protein n=1 Tax=Streptomyces sp. NPDC038707 TaxID=3154329 RepID=UPI0033CA3EC7